MLVDSLVKRCCTCKETLPISEFGRNRSRSDGHQPYCRTCGCGHSKKYVEKHPERRKETSRRYAKGYYERTKDARVLENRRRVAEWKKANPEQVRANGRLYYSRHKDQMYDNLKRWRAANPDKVRLQSARVDVEKRRASKRRSEAVRRALKLGTSVARFTQTQLEQRMVYWGNKCWMCGVDADTIDHVKPLSKGGPHILANLRPACGSCNSKKKNKWPFQPLKRANCAAA